MAVTDTIFSRLRGTFLSLFRINDVQLKRESSSAIGARDDTDAGYINVRGADPFIDDDLVTLRYLNSTGTSGEVRVIDFAVALVSTASVTPLTANTVPQTIKVQVTTPYSVAATLTVGKTGGSPTLLLSASDVNLQVAGIYYVPLDGVSWGAGAATISATIAGGPAVGACTITTEYVGVENP